MSTPTTATATLHPYPQHHFHYPHQSYPGQNSPSFRSANSLLTTTPRLAYPSTAGSVFSASSFASSHSGSNGLNLLPYPANRLPPLAPLPDCSGPPRYVDEHPAMPDLSQVPNGSQLPPPGGPPYQPAPAAPQPSTRKRRRSPRGEVDWSTFYKNGLPKEIIVIDDTPEPESAARPANPASGTMTNGHTNGHTNGIVQNGGDTSTRRPPAKKQKRNEPTRYDPVHQAAYAASHTDASNRRTTPSLSTVSSADRTASSTLHATVPASLTSGSTSTNGHYDYDVQPGQKRKRTRQNISDVNKLRQDPYFTYQPPMKPLRKSGEVHVKVITDPDFHKNLDVDDKDGHYIVQPNADLTDRYQIVKLLGQGTFGKVVQAKDRKRHKLVAIKIIRSVQKYRDASKIELRVLATLKANDEENRNRCIHLRDCFDFRGHICIVMDLLGQSVFDFLKSNSFVPFPNSQIQHFARQLLTSVAFLHDLNLIHTDLKPENILLCNNDYQTFTYNRKIPSSSVQVSRQATQRKVLLDTEIRLIDFGSATFQDEYHSSVVSTRHYRAPEIILGLGWSFPCDIWSIGCILVEFFTGDALFQTHDNLEHLAMMEQVVNQRIDTQLVNQVNRMNQRTQAGNAAAKYFKRARLDFPAPETTKGSRRFVKAMKKLEDIIAPNPNMNTSRFLHLFLDLLKKIFVYDPNARITAKEALDHPWFKEIAHPDDGTEAAKIRVEKMMRGQASTTLA